jgi:dTDP-4-dehydrorhamnose reductase
MRMLILGAAGQLGSDLASINDWSGPTWDIIPLTRNELDIADLAAIEPALARHEFDVLVNCAAFNDVVQIETDAAMAFKTNAYPCAELARLCRNRGARFVQVSTDYVFDGRAGRPYVETDPIGPINIFGASKAMGEHLAAINDPDALIVRVAALFGLNGVGGSGENFVEKMAQEARQNGRVHVTHDMTISTTWTCDAAKVINALLLERAPGGVYHVANGGQTTWFELAERIIRLSGTTARVKPVAAADQHEKVNRPVYSALNNGRASRLVGHIPHWADALEQYFWERQRAIREGRRPAD